MCVLKPWPPPVSPLVSVTKRVQLIHRHVADAGWGGMRGEGRVQWGRGPSRQKHTHTHAHGPACLKGKRRRWRGQGVVQRPPASPRRTLAAHSRLPLIPLGRHIAVTLLSLDPPPPPPDAKKKNGTSPRFFPPSDVPFFPASLQRPRPSVTIGIPVSHSCRL